MKYSETLPVMLESYNTYAINLYITREAVEEFWYQLFQTP